MIKVTIRPEYGKNTIKDWQEFLASMADKFGEESTIDLIHSSSGDVMYPDDVIFTEEYSFSEWDSKGKEVEVLKPYVELWCNTNG